MLEHWVPLFLQRYSLVVHVSRSAAHLRRLCCCRVVASTKTSSQSVANASARAQLFAHCTCLLLCSASGSFVLLDGDKIAALAAVYLRQLLSHAPPGTSDSVQIGVVQTAYANGASTRFLTEKLGLKVGCTNTGGGVCLALRGVCKVGVSC